ncbi:MAG: nucleotidyltransferase family protein [Dehalococcoidia bacterium]
MADRPPDLRLPDRAQTLLLQAAIRADGAAVDAWRRWGAVVAFDDVDGPSLAVLPAVAHNLQRAGHADELTPRLKGIARLAWVRNQLHIAGAAQAAHVLSEAGIPVMALKGIPLLARHYPDAGMRPMADVDLLVHPTDAGAADQQLRNAGWRRTSERPIAALQARAHAADLTSPNGAALDLHWRPIAQSWDAALDDAVWSRATPATVTQLTVPAAAPEDLLFHIIVHGVRGYPNQVIRWVIDAAMVLGSTPEFDWDLFFKTAVARRLTSATVLGLTYLREQQIAVPEDIVERLARVRPSLPERLERGLRPGAGAVAWMTKFEAPVYLRSTRGWPVHRRVTGIPAYLGVAWDVAPKRVPGEFLRRGRRVAVGAFSRRA